MILIFGPAGSGKTTQAQLLAAKYGFRWLGAGQLLRDEKRSDLTARMQQGELLDSQVVNDIVAKALERSSDVEHVILDGFPRSLDQAKWLFENSAQFGKTIRVLIVLDADRQEIYRRLELRGRMDDNPASIDARLERFRIEMEPILDYFRSQNVEIVKISGNNSIDEVHDEIVNELKRLEII